MVLASKKLRRHVSHVRCVLSPPREETVSDVVLDMTTRFLVTFPAGHEESVLVQPVWLRDACATGFGAFLVTA